MNFFSEELAKNDLVAAPMAGLSTAPFRKVLRDFTDGLVYTEMISVEGVKRANPHSTEFLDRMDGDTPVVAQFFGGNSSSYPLAIAEAERYCPPSAYDINMGCPVKKVIRAGGGCALLKDLDNAVAIVRAVRSATSKPFSIKIRIGWDDSMPVYRELLDIAQSEGADALILHARTRPQMFGGAVRYDTIAELAAIAKIPIIGNGDIWDYESYRRIKETGAQGAMIGRAMLNWPWVFQAVKQKKNPMTYPPKKRYELLMKLLRLMREHAGEDRHKLFHYMNIIRKQAVWFSKGLPDAAQFRVEVFKDNDTERYLNAFEYFKNLQYESEDWI